MENNVKNCKQVHTCKNLTIKNTIEELNEHLEELLAN